MVQNEEKKRRSKDNQLQKDKKRDDDEIRQALIQAREDENQRKTNEFNTIRELEKKALEEKEAAELLIKQAADKEATAHLAWLAA
eukprot:9001447-Heterocapsa_arctica.AAC.1